jgi:hypothetical protein
MAHTDNGGSNGRQLAGVVAFFTDPDQLIEATRKTREARYKYFDAFTPYPVHGLEQAQGLKRSPLPYVTFAAGLTGVSLAFLFQYWTSAVNWPLNIGGKPFNSWPAFVPIMFELTVLLGGLSTVAAMFLLNGLPNITKRAFDSGITRDRFALMIEAPPEGAEDDDAERASQGKAPQYKKFNEREATELLRTFGAAEVRSVYAEGWF